MKKYVFALLLTLAVMFASCSRDETSPPEGTYAGTHILYYSTDHEPLKWDITLTFSGNEVIMNDGLNTYNGHSGHGTFSIKRGKIFLKFEPMMVLAIYLSTPVIGGECDYSLDGNQLNISKKITDEWYNGSVIECRLTKVD